MIDWEKWWELCRNSIVMGLQKIFISTGYPKVGCWEEVGMGEKLKWRIQDLEGCRWHPIG